MKIAYLVVAALLLITAGANAQELENLAFEKPATVNGDQGNAHLLTDGITTSNPYINGATEVMVDLEDEQFINIIKLWHYWADLRIYQDNKIAVSTEDQFRGEETVVFDTNGGDDEYAESAEGKTIVFEAVKARYVKGWVGRSNVNQWSHWVELQVFFDESLFRPVESTGKLAISWANIKKP